MNAELKDTITSIALSHSPTVQQLLLKREMHAMEMKHHNTLAGEARKRLEAVNAQLKEIGYVF